MDSALIMIHANFSSPASALSLDAVYVGTARGLELVRRANGILLLDQRSSVEEQGAHNALVAGSTTAAATKVI